MLQKTE